MVWLVHRIKPYTVEAAAERKPRTFTGSTEDGYKLVAEKERNKTNPRARARTRTGTWAKLGTDITEQAQYRWEEYNNSIKQTVQSRSQSENKNGVLWVLLCCFQTVCFGYLSVYLLLSHAQTQRQSHIRKYPSHSSPCPLSDAHQPWEALHFLRIKDTCYCNQPSSGYNGVVDF